MITKAKALYQVKLILEYLPREEYKLIPKEIIDYIDENFEYDENFTINPSIPLEKQKIDDKTYDLLKEIIKKVKNLNLNNIILKSNVNFDIEEYVKNVKESNKYYETKIENIGLNNLVELLKKENDKIPKAKELVEEYKKIINQKIDEIERLKRDNQYLYKCIQKLPKIVRKIFIKDFDKKLLD